MVRLEAPAENPAVDVATEAALAGLEESAAVERVAASARRAAVVSVVRGVGVLVALAAVVDSAAEAWTPTRCERP